METYRIPLSDNLRFALTGIGDGLTEKASYLGQGRSEAGDYNISDGKVTDFGLLRSGFNIAIPGQLERILFRYQFTDTNPPYQGPPGGLIGTIRMEFWQEPYESLDSSFNNLIYSFEFNVLDGTTVYEIDLAPGIPLDRARLLVQGLLKPDSTTQVSVNGRVNLTMVVRP